MSASLTHRAAVGARARNVEVLRAPPRRLPPSPLCNAVAAAVAAAPCRSPLASSSRPRLQTTLSRAIVAARADDDIAAFDGKPRYGRVLLKLSGEALAGDAGTGVDPTVLASVAADVAAAVRAGVEVAVVVGGGNYYRGAAAASSTTHQSSVDRATGDYVGMLATVMNALLLQGALERAGVATRVQTAIEMRQIAEPYIRRRAMRHLERGRVVIFGAGTGNPFFTTDSAAALRAAEVGADALLKATKVDGVFDRDPSGADGAAAVLLRSLSYSDVASRKLAVMDGTAVTLAAENGIDCVVFNMRRPGHVERALLGDPNIGTSISDRSGSAAAASSSSSSSAAAEGAGGGGDGSPRSSSPAAAARELLRAPTVTQGGAAWRGAVGVQSDGDEGPSVGC